MADAIIAQTETEYEIRVSRGAVRFIVRAANINDAVVKAQRVVNTWQFKVFREHERLVVRRIENGRGPPTPAQRAKLFDDYAALIRERDRLEASLKVDSL